MEFVPGLDSFSPRILDRINVEGLYKQHVIRQTHDVELFLRDENLLIDEDLDYSLLPGMSNEVRQRLSLARPLTLVRPSFLCTAPLLIPFFTGTCEAPGGRNANESLVAHEARPERSFAEGAGAQVAGRFEDGNLKHLSVSV